MKKVDENGVSHITSVGGNVFADLGFSKAESAELQRIRSIKMATKKTTKKVVKKATKRTVKDNRISWVLSERSKLFVWTPIRVYRSYTKAATARQELEALSIYGSNGYKVSRVVKAD